jgi:hypothetical protein
MSILISGPRNRSGSQTSIKVLAAATLTSSSNHVVS